MDSPELRQLKQRITLRCQLEPLQELETRKYIWRRLARAGVDDSQAATLFPEATTAAVYRYSRGIPRLINTICENALILAYAKQSRTVAGEVIDEIARDLRLHVTPRPVTSEPGISVSRQDLARSLLDLINVLERAARAPLNRPSAHEAGAKIV